MTTASVSTTEAVNLLSVLACQPRLDIAVVLAEHGATSVGDILGKTGAGHAATSHHLALMKACGLLSCERRGKQNFYSLMPGKLAIAQDVLAGLAAGRKTV